MKLYFNEETAILSGEENYLLFNFTNGIVAVVDKTGKNFIEKIKKNSLGEGDMTVEEKEFFDYLVDNDFVATSPFERATRPMSAYVHLTNKCNLHCIGCYSNNDRRNKCEDLSTEELKSGLDQLREVGVENLVFSGGEPLLTKNIIDIVRYAKKICRFPNTILITNGTIFNKKILSNLSKYIDTVSVSLDTYCSEGEPFLRDPYIFDKIMQSIKWLIETGNHVNIIPTIHHLNAKDIDKYVEIARRLDVDISLSLLSACYEGELLNYLPSNDDLLTISDFMQKTDMGVEDSSLDSIGFHAENYCGAGQSIIAVGTNGDVYSCHMLMYDEFSLGNIKKGRIKDMLKDSGVSKWFGKIDVNHLHGECPKCPFKYFCGGGCRARAYMMSKDVLGKDPYCLLFKDYYKKTTKQLFEC